MNDIRFPRWLAGVGVFGGVAIALGLPAVILTLGGGLAPRAQVTIIIFALIVGALLAAVSAIVGLAVPTTVKAAAIPLECCEPCCPEQEEAEPADPDVKT